MRATCRMTGFAKRTVERGLREIGEACAALMDAKMVNLTLTQIQCDEIWSFIYCKDKHVTPDMPVEAGDSWTWVAIDRVTKLIPVWHVGNRSAQSAYAIMLNLQKRLANRVQLTTDGHSAYLIAVRAAFNAQPIDYGMLVKIYGEGGEGKYSPGIVTGAKKEAIMGNPNVDQICTSHAERQNLTIRMSVRRFTRLTNAFSKSLVNHRHSLALHFAHYNFCRVHQTLRVTPAMEAGITDHVWELAELVALAERAEAAP
jgi:IS1 family transposase